jgi:hypothetical protein
MRTQCGLSADERHSGALVEAPDRPLTCSFYWWPREDSNLRHTV